MADGVKGLPYTIPRSLEKEGKNRPAIGMLLDRMSLFRNEAGPQVARMHRVLSGVLLYKALPGKVRVSIVELVDITFILMQCLEERS